MEFNELVKEVVAGTVRVVRLTSAGGAGLQQFAVLSDGRTVTVTSKQGQALLAAQNVMESQEVKAVIEFAKILSLDDCKAKILNAAAYARARISQAAEEAKSYIRRAYARNAQAAEGLQDTETSALSELEAALTGKELR